MCTLPGNQGETSREPASVEGKQGLLPCNLDLKDLPQEYPTVLPVWGEIKLVSLLLTLPHIL